MPVVNARIQHFDAIPLAVVRREARQSDLSRVVPECCGLVWNELRAQGVRGGRNVAVYLDGVINLEVGVEMTGPFTERNGVVRSATPAGTVACATYFGPYAGLGSAHDAIRQLCQAEGRKAAGPQWEIYGHWQSAWDADPSQIRTDVCYLLAP